LLRNTRMAALVAAVAMLSLAVLVATAGADHGAKPPKSDNPTGAIVGTPGNDTLTGTPGDDIISGRGGNDNISGLAGNDRLNGGSGDDTVSGGDGNDRVRGGKGADTLTGDAGNDRLKGGKGADSLDGGPGDDLLDGRGDGRTADTVTCGEGNDVARLDKNDVIADATPAAPNGSCEVVKRNGHGKGKSKPKHPRGPKQDGPDANSGGGNG
jgi:Ca2+-binding RTX toxin-like protein